VLFDYCPIPTALCDQCADRLEKGKDPMCTHHCQAKCMTFGPIEELQKQMAGKPKQCLYAL
jgi:anaerobic dimethyl sulfoxide reductase subunit B (iron-sulfur subunit)